MSPVNLASGRPFMSDSVNKTGLILPSWGVFLSSASDRAGQSPPALNLSLPVLKVVPSPPSNALPLRNGAISIAELIDLYMASYAGRDGTRLQRLTWWSAKVGNIALADIGDDDIHNALEQLSRRQATFFAGLDADGNGIFKSKKNCLAPATINRYAASLGAVLTWAMQRRIAPKGWVHPCRSIERKPENNAKVRFLDDVECTKLLEACGKSTWPKLTLLVLLAITTGARKGELLALRWGDIDVSKAVAHCATSKNGDPKVLPLVPKVVGLMKNFTGSPSALVFGSARNPGMPFAFETRWAIALQQAGIRNFRFHDLRHTCASMLAQNGATLLEIGDVLGHRQIAMTKRCSHLTTGHKAALINRVLGAVGN